MSQQKFPAPNPDNILAISTLVVGVGAGGNTSMLAYVSTYLDVSVLADVHGHKSCSRGGLQRSNSAVHACPADNDACNRLSHFNYWNTT